MKNLRELCTLILMLGVAFSTWAAPRLAVFHQHVLDIAEQEGIGVRAAAERMLKAGITGLDVIDGKEDQVPDEAFAAGLRPVTLVEFVDFAHSDDAEAVDRAFRTVKEKGYERIMLVPGFVKADEDREQAWQAAKPRLAAFLKRAAAERVEVAFEDFDSDRALVGSREHIRRLLKEFPMARHVLDTGNYIYWKDDPIAATAEFLPRVSHVHVKDIGDVPVRQTVAAGGGFVPLPSILRQLAAHGYDGWYAVELYGSRRKRHLADILASVAYLKRAIAAARTAPVVHVAPTGDDVADGSAAHPVRTLVRARDLLRMKRHGTGGGVVQLADGEYPVETALTLTAADGGASKDEPVVWTAEPGAEPRLTGGFRVRGFKPAGAAFPSGTLVADVKAQGYGDVPERLPFGYHSPKAVPPQVDLFCDGTLLTLAREPNEGRWLRSMDNPVEGATNVVRTFLHRPERFTPDKAPDLMAHGYWKVFWADEVVKAEMTDASDCRLTFRGAYGFPGSKPEAMFYLFNAPTALDQPGEWYLDRAKGLLYVLPPTGTRADAEYVLTRAQQPFVAFEGASNIILEGWSLAYGGAAAITGTNGVNVTVRGNAIRNFGGWGLSFAGTDGLTVRGNVLDGFGRGGINVIGGDRRTLRDGRTHVEANDVGHTGRAQRTYTAGLNYYGCGLVAVRNRFHDLPAHGVNARGNDIFFASNVVERVCLESDDQGGSDIFGNLGFRNVRYVQNVWRDIGPKTDFATCGAGGVRLDDAISGETVYGNRFIRCAQGHFGGVQVNGGLENVIDNNLFVGCKYAVSFMYPNTDWQWAAFLRHPRSQRFHHVETEIGKPPYSTRYPQLVDWPKRAKKNRVMRNVAVGSSMILGPDGAAVECVVEAADNVLLPAEADGEAAFASGEFDPLPPLEAIGTPAFDPYLFHARRMSGNVLEPRGDDVRPRYPILLDAYSAAPIMTAAQKSPFGDDAFIRACGYTGRIALGGTTALTFDRYAPNAVRRGTDARAWIEARQVTCAKEYALCRQHGLEVIMSFDILVVPETLLTLYKNEMTDEQGRISIRRPRTQAVFRAMLDELFERFPEVDGVMTRFGETYCHLTPYHSGMSPAHSAADHAEVVKLLRDEVCVRRGKKLFYRTWDFGFLHTHAENYLAASDSVEPHPLLYYAVKHSNADFMRDYPFNETVGIGKHQQIVEVSMNQAGVYGKNAYPYYFAKGVLDGFNDDDPKTRYGIRALKDKSQVKGFWLWQYGDGWEGPYAPHELWLRLNEAVVRGAILKPEATEEELFLSAATDVCGVDRRDLARFREFCLKSEDAVYFGQHTKKTAVCEWWNRDHYFASVDLEPAVRAGKLDEVLQEKADNLGRWRKMEELIAGVRFADPMAAEFARVSTTYGRIRYEVGALVWKIDGYLAACRVAGKAPDKARAKALSDEFDAKWREWEALKAANPRTCPTLYRISSQQKHYSPPLFCRSLAKIRLAAGLDNLYPYGEELFGQ